MKNLPAQIAQQFKEMALEGDWVAKNLKTQLSDVSWKQAITPVGSLNTIAALTFHIHYYIAGQVKVFEGGPLDIRDTYSYNLPPIESEDDWNRLREQLFEDAEKYVSLVSQMPEEKMEAGFVDEKYGNYYRNIHAILSHSYYHLGQIAVIKKLLTQPG